MAYDPNQQTPDFNQFQTAMGVEAPGAPTDPSSLLDPNNIYKVLPQLGQLPMIDVNNEQNYMGQLGQQSDAAMQGYWNYQTPQMQAAQIDKSGVPNPNAQQFGTSPELQKLLSGQGYDPQILAMMKASATEAPAAAGAQQMAAERRALGEAGLGTSPAGAAVTGDIARNVGDQQVQAQHAVDVGNAQMANENLKFGVGQQSQIGISNIEMANQMAMTNANRLFAAMQQNSQQQQQANATNMQAQNTQKTNEATQRSNNMNNIVQDWSKAREDYNMRNQQTGQQQQTIPFQAATNLQNNTLGYMNAQAPPAPVAQ